VKKKRKVVHILCTYSESTVSARGSVSRLKRALTADGHLLNRLQLAIVREGRTDRAQLSRGHLTFNVDGHCQAGRARGLTVPVE